MSIEERKAREKERRRNTILDAAEEIIFSRGLEQVTMEEIAEKAELSKGTLYLYFASKNELYMAICQRGLNLLNKQFSKIFTGDHSGLELTRLMGETYLDFVQNNPGYFNSIGYYENLKMQQELKDNEIAQICEENRREAMTYMIRALQIGMQDGTIDDSFDPNELALLIWASTLGIVIITHMKQNNHHIKMLDDLDINIGSIYKNFLNLIGSGMATQKGREQKKKMTNGHFNK